MERKPIVLFLCTHNAARSQMAEGFLRQLGGDRFEAVSAGLDPTTLHPLAVQVMAEVGIDISHQKSKSLTEFLAKVPVKYAIFVCRNVEGQCPRIWPFVPIALSWPLDDPATSDEGEESLERFRRVRDEIEHKIRTWLHELATESAVDA